MFPVITMILKNITQCGGVVPNDKYENELLLYFLATPFFAIVILS